MIGDGSKSVTEGKGENENLLTMEYDVKDANTIDATIAGSIWKVLMKQGDIVRDGQAVVILESMNMEFSITTTIEGKVKAILREPGQIVQPGDAVIVLE